MKIENFKSGSYKQNFQYKSFRPSPVNLEWTWDDPAVNTLLEAATQAISELNAFSLIVPDMNLFISMHITKEADMSSRIEGTQTTLEDALKNRDQVEPEKRNDWQEVRNYIQALNAALAALETLPLSNRLLKDTHEILMQSVRGEHKFPGEFRVSQNWIGGTSLTDAVFVPPHHEDVPEMMADLEKFLHNEKIHVPHLIRIAIAHYQFETIHPFLDGNGRIGRVLIPLYLISKHFLSQPSLYVSDYLERHKGAYYDALTTVRSSSNLLHWIKFFLTALIETARKGKATFQGILAIKTETDQVILTMGRRAEKARLLVDYLYKNPIVSVMQIAEMFRISHQAASQLTAELVAANILKEKTGQRRNRIYAFERYLDLFRR